MTSNENKGKIEVGLRGIDAEVFRAFKIVAIKRSVSIGVLANEAFADLVKKYENVVE